MSSDDAARLRRTGWRRLVAAFGSTRDVFSRPLAIGLTTIGLAGLLVSTASGFLPTGGPTALTIGQAAGGAGAAAESLDAARSAPEAASQAPAAPSDGSVSVAALPAASPASTEAPLAVASAAPSAESFDTFAGPSGATGAPGAAPVAPAPDASGQRDLTHSTAVAAMDARSGETDARRNVIVMAGLLLLVGLALFGLRWAARRV